MNNSESLLRGGVVCRPLICAIGLTILSGCDSTSSDTDFDDGVRTGQFIDSPVANIAYRTATQSGFTNEQGEFLFHSGESVTFSIGGIDLPSAVARRVVTPLTLVGVDTASDTTVLNISRLLLSLDTDANPDNGIRIDNQAHRTAQSLSLDFSAADFAALVTNLVANSGSVNTSLVSALAAQQHLEEQLALIPTDSDNDGVIDTEDAFPNDPQESVDTDQDGVGDNADYAPNDATIQTICQSDAPAEDKTAAGCDNTAPVAVAGDDQTVGPLVSVPLDASLSYDADGDTLAINWQLVQQPQNAVAAITEATSANARFSGGDLEGDYVVRLTVSDAFGVTASDELVVTVDKSLPGGLAIFLSANMLTATFVLLGRYRRRTRNSVV